MTHTVSSFFKNPPFYYVLIASILLFTACDNNKSIEYPKMDPNFSSFIYAYTSGVISKADPIIIKFNDAVIETSKIGEEDEDNVITFRPSIRGKAIWEDTKTLRFTPTDHLPEKTEFLAKVKVNKIYKEVPSNLNTFEFVFKTREQYFSVNFDGLVTPDVANLKAQQFKGKVVTADIVNNLDLEKVLEFSQPGNNNLTIKWQHSLNQLEHPFVINNVNRSDKASKINLSWNGNPIGVKIKDGKEIEVPAFGDFKVLEARVVQEEEQYIYVNFSDPLLKSQDLEGLVKIVGANSTNLKYVVDGNELRVYPSKRIQGKRKVNFLPGIQNSERYKMINKSAWDLSFESVKPELKLVGKGIIMPGSEGLIFPFEAVSLKAVDVEIFKIFQNNILQFLQDNNYEGDYNLYRVGRVVHQEKVSLEEINPNASSDSWTQYALDLSKMINRDPGAIYQVRIGFKKEYSAFKCEGESTDNDLAFAGDDNHLEDGEFKSFWNRGYRYYRYPGYKYQHRKDPCYPPYYQPDNFIRRNVLASNIGIIAKRGTDGSMMVAVTDITTAQPISGAKIEFFDYQQQSIGEFSTDTEGLLSTVLKRKPFVAVVSRGDEKGYLKLEDGTSLSLSKFDVSGQQVYKGLKGFIYGERGVWRPGDSIYLTFIVEDKNGTLPGNHPVTFEFFDPRGQLQQKQTKSLHVNNMYSFKTATTADAPTGIWRANIKVGGASFSKSVRVETVKPNRLKIDIDFGKEELQVEDTNLKGKLQVNWLHGAPAKNVRTEIKLEMKPINTYFKSYKEFEFDDPARSFKVEPQTIFDDKVNEKGATTFESKLSTGDAAPGKVKVFFTSRAFENGGDFSSDNFSMTYNPYSAYTGIRIPKNKYNSKRFNINENNDVEFVVVDKDGKPMANKTVKVGVYRVTWRWWWDRSRDNQSNYASSDHVNALKSASITTNSKGVATWSVKPETWGRYLVRACDPTTGHCTGDYAYSGSPWDDDTQSREGSTMLAFSSDREKYEVGETVTLRIPTGKEGRALVTIENGSKVIESHWVNAKKGETKFSFYATEEMTPTIYAHVALLQPHGQMDNDLPIRMYGVIPINIENKDSRIQPVLDMKEVLKPEETYTVQVKEKDGKAMAYTIAVVDDGLLDLTRYKTPNPWSAFYAREALGVQTWDMFDHVLGAYGGDLERILSVGGDEAVKPSNAKKANRFKPVVAFLGPYYLKRGEKATHEIKMPNYVGSVRAMVVAANQGAYGNAEKTVPVRKPVMVLATLPRVLGPTELVKLPVTVFAMEDKVKQVDVKLEANSMFEIVGDQSKTVTFSSPDEKVVEFTLKVKEALGIGSVRVTATGAGETSYQEIELDVRNPNPKVTDVAAKLIDKGESWSQGFDLVGMKGTNTGILEVSNIPPINMGRRMNYLIRYPHGCLEQTTSAAFPQLYAGKILDLTTAQKEQAEGNLKAAITKLKKFQLTSGGFVYWPGNSYPNYWGSTYAGHFLFEAKKLGYNVPQNLIDNWISYQKKTARSWSPETYPYRWGYRGNVFLQQAYRLYTLALANSPELGAMNRMREMKDVSSTAKWRLAAAYALAGKPEIAKEIIRGLSTEVKPYRELSYTYGSDLRDRAMILETLVLLDDRKKAAEVMKQISDQLGSDRWHSTQTVAYCLLAIGKFVGSDDLSKGFKFNYKIGDAASVNAGSDKPVFQIPIDVDGTANKSINVSNATDGILFARLILQGQPVVGDQTAASNKLTMDVNYMTLDGKKFEPGKVEQGTDFIAEVVISNPGLFGRYTEMALSQIFPSGWEIHNTRMNNVGNALKSSVPEYQDIRDDRVYNYFDIRPEAKHTYHVQLNAAYQGRYYLPSTYCESMYDNTINARKPGQWVEVVGPSE